MRRVPVVGIVRGELKVPLQFAGVAIQRHERARVEIVARARIGVPIGAGIADAPVDGVRLGIVRAGYPGGTATGLPAIAEPRIVAGFAGRGDRIEAPGALAGARIVRVEEAADAGLTAAHTHHDLAADGQRRQGHAVSGFVVFDLYGPALEAALGVERDQVAIERGDEDLIVENRGAAIHPAEANALVVLRDRALPGPQLAPGADVERRRGIGAADVHHAIGDDWRHLGAIGKLIGPAHAQSAGVGRGDLSQRRVAMPLVTAGVGQPVGGLLGRIDDALVWHLRRRGGTEQRGIPLHGFPFRVAR